MRKHHSLAVAWFVLEFGTFVFTKMSTIVPTVPIAMLIARVHPAVQSHPARTTRKPAHPARVVLSINSMEQVWADKLVSPVHARLERIANLTRVAAANGAEIVSFQEFAIIIDEDDVEQVRSRYRSIADDNDVYLSITYAYYARDGKGENKHLLIDDDGDVRLDYTKRYVSGIAELDVGEAGVYRKGPDVLQSTPRTGGSPSPSAGTWSSPPTCGRRATPAWTSCCRPRTSGRVAQSCSAHHRTIENGFSLVRPTFNGITIAANPNGEILARMDTPDDGDGVMYAAVPTRGGHDLPDTGRRTRLDQRRRHGCPDPARAAPPRQPNTDAVTRHRPRHHAASTRDSRRSPPRGSTRRHSRPCPPSCPRHSERARPGAPARWLGPMVDVTPAPGFDLDGSGR